MFGAPKPGFRSLATPEFVVNVVANFIPKRTAAASRGFLATVQLSCLVHLSYSGARTVIWGRQNEGLGGKP